MTSIQVCIDKLRLVFIGQELISPHYIRDYAVDLYLPEYKLAVMFDETFDTRDYIHQSSVVSIEGCSFIRCRPSDDMFAVAGRIYAFIHRPSVPISQVMLCVSVPSEVVLLIVKYARVGDWRDKYTLRTLSQVSKTFNRTMKRHHAEIIKHYTIKDTINGEVTYELYGELHRSGDEPARICDEYQGWYWHGMRHREGDEPAVIWTNGRKEWYRYDMLHREGDKPAVIGEYGSQEWWQGDELHRDGDKPAEVTNDRTQRWYQRGLLHRDGGEPAEVYPDGFKAWYWHGEGLYNSHYMIGL